MHQSLAGQGVGYNYELLGPCCSLDVQAKQPHYTKGRSLKEVIGGSGQRKAQHVEAVPEAQEPPDIERELRGSELSRAGQQQLCVHRHVLGM